MMNERIKKKTIDVLPFVPILWISLTVCAQLLNRFFEQTWKHYCFYWTNDFFEWSFKKLIDFYQEKMF